MSEESGPFDFQAFLIGMNKLFEKFVTQVLRERAGSRFTVDDQVSIHLGYEQNVPMRPDMIVSEGGRLGFVTDCKYKRLWSPASSRTTTSTRCSPTALRLGVTRAPDHHCS